MSTLIPEVCYSLIFVLERYPHAVMIFLDIRMEWKLFDMYGTSDYNS